MINSSATAEIVQKIAHALNLKVSSFYNNCLTLKSLREDADPMSNVELSSPGHLRICTFLSYKDLLYHILHNKSIHIYRGHIRGRPFRDDWIKLVNPFYHLAPEEAVIKADLEKGGSHGQSA